MNKSEEVTPVTEAYKVGDIVRVLGNSLEAEQLEASKYIGLTGTIVEVVRYRCNPERVEYDLAIKGIEHDGEWTFNPAYMHSDLLLIKSKRKAKENK